MELTKKIEDRSLMKASAVGKDQCEDRRNQTDLVAWDVMMVTAMTAEGRTDRKQR